MLYHIWPIGAYVYAVLPMLFSVTCTILLVLSQENLTPCFKHNEWRQNHLEFNARCRSICLAKCQILPMTEPNAILPEHDQALRKWSGKSLQCYAQKLHGICKTVSVWMTLKWLNFSNAQQRNQEKWRHLIKWASAHWSICDVWWNPLMKICQCKSGISGPQLQRVSSFLL